MTDAEIGEFASEHRQRVQQILGLEGASTAQTLDLQDIIKTAVRETIEQVGVKVGALGAGAGKGSRSPSERVAIIVQGRRTSVTLPRQLILDAQAALGGSTTVTKLVQELAQGVPADEQNRSGWIQERLRATLLSADSAPSQQRH